MSSSAYSRNGLGLRPIINVSGTMTALGASIIVPEAVAAMTAIASEFVEIDDLHHLASDTIARATGAEAGYVTASAAAGIIIAVAASMTGDNSRAVERLPLDTQGLRTEIVIQHGHDVSYGTSISQAVRMAGGKPVLCGSVSHVSSGQLEDAITEDTAAGLYVVAHTTSQYGMLGLEEFASLCHARSVPVIVDAASEYDLRGFLAAGADLVIYSGHKFLGGPTSGIIAGRRDLIKACRLQNGGIGRAMKVGKESIAGVMAALDAWGVRDHAAVRKTEQDALALWLEAATGVDGIEATIVPDPTGNPLDRLQLRFALKCTTSADVFARTLAAGTPPIMVRAHQAGAGLVWLDPCNLHPNEAECVAKAISSFLASLK